MIADCRYETERLRVSDWHSHAVDLENVVMTMLTVPVTGALPPTWQGEYSRQRASDWIRERDAESTVLLAIDRSTSEPVGLLILFEETDAVRIGYLLSETVWGQGLASELVGGLVDWCASQDSITKLVAGVDSNNLASIRVLQKSGFLPAAEGDVTESGDRVYEMNLT